MFHSSNFGFLSFKVKGRGYVNFIKIEDLKFQGQVCEYSVCFTVNNKTLLSGVVKD